MANGGKTRRRGRIPAPVVRLNKRYIADMVNRGATVETEDGEIPRFILYNGNTYTLLSQEDQWYVYKIGNA